MSLIQIEIKNWSKFQEREDRSNYVWFKFSNGFFSDPKLFPLSIGARFLFVYILCERSKVESNTVSLNFELAAFTLRTTQENILKQLKELEDISVIRQENPGNSRTDACLDKRDKKDKIRVDLPAKASPKTPHPIVRAWKEHRGTLPDVRGCSVGRLKHINARWAENPSEDFWKGVVVRVSQSAFCTGKNDRGWKADFDFLIKPDTAHKILEGKYDDRGNGLAPKKRDFSIEEIKAMNEGREA